MRVIHDCTGKPDVTEELDRLAFFNKGEAVAWWTCPECGSMWELSMLSYRAVWRIRHRKMHHEKRENPIPLASPTEKQEKRHPDFWWLFFMYFILIAGGAFTIAMILIEN